MMKAMPGGIRLPRLAPAAMVPSTMRWSYLRCLKEGSATVEIVAAVATDEPETAENSAEAPMLVCSRPPGRRLSQSDSEWYILSVAPPRIRISPSRMYSGIQPDRGDYAVQIPLVGAFEARTGNVSHAIGRRHVAVGSPGREQTILSAPDCARLTNSMGRDAVIKQLSALIGDAVINSLISPLQCRSTIGMWPPSCAWHIGDGRYWNAIPRCCATGWLRRTGFERGYFVTALLLARDSDYRQRLEAPREGDMCVRSVKRAVDYIEAHAAVLAGPGRPGGCIRYCRARALPEHFRMSEGMSPMAYVRGVRLQKAREEMLRCDGTGTVTEIAMHWGSDHLRRFGVEYRRRYGETPSTTLRRRR